MNPHLLMSSQIVSYQLTQTLGQHALAASCVGYLVPAGARIDQKVDQCNRGMLLLIAIKSDLSLILFMGQLEEAIADKRCCQMAEYQFFTV